VPHGFFCAVMHPEMGDPTTVSDASLDRGQFGP